MSDIDIILQSDYAKKNGYDEADFFKKFEDINVYKLRKSKWPKGHRVGMPPLAIVEDGKAQILTDKEAIYVCSFSS